MCHRGSGLTTYVMEDSREGFHDVFRLGAASLGLRYDRSIASRHQSQLCASAFFAALGTSDEVNWRERVTLYRFEREPSLYPRPSRALANTGPTRLRR